ncbi:MAG TPA: hypothetical protein PLS10_12920 [Chitinophagales bacterium]|nr:hypothetical protein [Chitinophagales bacterium]
MQIRGKILTITGIVLIFGYFIRESFVSPSSSNVNQIIMIGNDTLGKDWGSIANQREQEQQSGRSNEGTALTSATEETNATIKDDPFSREKFDQGNYSSIQSPDGREIITNYDRPEDIGSPDINSQTDNYQTRHQQEKGQITEEPSINYKE